jgi:hypothetical protein
MSSLCVTTSARCAIDVMAMIIPRSQALAENPGVQRLSQLCGPKIRPSIPMCAKIETPFPKQPNCCFSKARHSDLRAVAPTGCADGQVGDHPLVGWI